MVLSAVYICDLVCIFDLCIYVCVFMYSRTIAHVELMFLLIKPTLNKVYFTLLYFNKKSERESDLFNLTRESIGLIH